MAVSSQLLCIKHGEIVAVKMRQRSSLINLQSCVEQASALVIRTAVLMQQCWLVSHRKHGCIASESTLPNDATLSLPQER